MHHRHLTRKWWQLKNPTNFLLQVRRNPEHFKQLLFVCDGNEVRSKRKDTLLTASCVTNSCEQLMYVISETANLVTSPGIVDT